MTIRLRKLVLAIGAALVSALSTSAYAQTVETATVSSQSSERVVTLPAELVPYQAVALSARVSGFVERIDVDRGTVVKQGQVLAELSAPELAAQVAEARSRVLLAETRKAEAEARLATATSTLDRLTRAAATPGTVAGIDVFRAQEEVAAARAAVDTQVQAVAGATSAVDAVRALEKYQTVVAPFAGHIVERLVHPGALVGPTTGPLLRLEQTSRLRLVIPVPEHDLGAVAIGRAVEFHVPSHPGRTFTAKIARSAGSLDARTRTMVVEADVDNAGDVLAPGMFPTVSWPMVRDVAAMFVPATAVVTTTERTFVIRVVGGKAEWVTVKKGSAAGDLVEVQGALAPGDVVVKRGTDEIRNGSTIKR